MGNWWNSLFGEEDNDQNFEQNNNNNENDHEEEKKVLNNNFEYIAQAKQKTIKEKWGYEINIDKNNRSFDFAIYDTDTNKLSLIEVNYYSGGGSKLKSVAGEFEKLYSFLHKQNINFYWITDGHGWKTAKRPLEETYNKIDKHIYNIEHLKNDLLKKLLK